MNDETMAGVAAHTLDGEQADTWSLVLSAAHIPHRLARREKGWSILVPTGVEAIAAGEITAFERENANWPPPRHAQEESGAWPANQATIVPVLGALVVLFSITGPWSAASVWFSRGAAVSDRIIDGGQWWRVVTALTLHADTAHLLGNVVIGGMLAYFLCRHLGSGLAWLLVILTGAAGNLINAALRGPGYQSVGFSTSVFGMVGVLSGLQAAKKGALRGMLLPLGGAAGLLALLGSEGERTDLGAHLWGLAAGLALGGLLRFFPGILRWSARQRHQQLLFVLSMLIVGYAWWIAWHS